MEVNDLIDLRFTSSTKGPIPISRTIDGKFALINGTFRGIIDIGSTWKCRIDKIEKFKVIISPISLQKL
jgi:hypothetical protein